MDEEAVEPQNEMNQIIDTAEENSEAVSEDAQQEEQSQEKTMVPLSALQKVREKKRELELELKWERERAARQQATEPVQDDGSRYESATREDLSRSQMDTIRAVEERIWIRQNQEKYEKINEYLPEFLKQRPHLTSAIQQSPNRYEEAFLLMEAFNPKFKPQVKEQAPKKVAPNAPASVPKAAALNEAVDVMKMSDAEFSEWRKSQKRRR